MLLVLVTIPVFLLIYAQKTPLANREISLDKNGIRPGIMRIRSGTAINVHNYFDSSQKIIILEMEPGRLLLPHEDHLLIFDRPGIFHVQNESNPKGNGLILISEPVYKFQPK
jgi:hypothetical protein